MSTLSTPVPFALIEQVFREAAGAVADAGVEFAMAGSFAMWGHGAAEPPMVEDVDLALRRADVATAARALRDAGFRIEVPPHGWLVKAYHPATNDVGEHLFVDLIHDLIGVPVDDAMLARAPQAYLSAIAVKILAPIDIVAANLRVLAPSCLDYTDVVQHARFLSAHIDWDELERRMAEHPAGLAFFDIARRMGIDPRHTPADGSVAAPWSHQPATRAARMDDDLRRELEGLVEH